MLLRQTILYLPAQFLGPLVQFMSVVVWTHWLMPVPFGELMLITASHELAYAVSLSWFSLYAVRHIPHANDRAGRLRFYQTEASVIAVSSLASAAVALALLYLVFEQPPSLLLVIVSVAYYITRSINIHIGERVRADEEIVNYTLLQTIGPVFGFLLGLLFMALLEPTPRAVIGAYVLAQMLAMVIVYARTECSFDITRPDPDVIREALHYGSPIMVSNWLSWFSDHGIRFVVKYGLDVAAVGLMSVAWGLGRRSTAFATNLVSAAAFPLAVKRLKDGSREDAMTQISMNGALMFGVLAPTVVGLWSINTLAVTVLIDEAFRQVTIDLLPLAVLAGGVRNFRLHYPDHVFLLDGNTRIFFVIDSVEAVAVLILSLAGLLSNGLYGAVAGATVGVIVGTVCGFYLAYQTGGFRLAIRHMTIIAMACALMALVLQLVPFPQTMLGLVTAVLLGAAVYALALAPFYGRELPTLMHR